MKKKVDKSRFFFLSCKQIWQFYIVQYEKKKAFSFLICQCVKLVVLELN